MTDRALDLIGDVTSTGTGDRGTVGIVGLGYVGLPLAVAFCEAGYTVVGVDVDPGRIAMLARGESPIEDVPDETLRSMASRFQPTVRYADLSKADAVLIAVPTPLTPNREPDLGPLSAAGFALAAVLQRRQLVVLESTTYPGYTRERLIPLLEESGLAAGVDFHVAFSPERIDPGRSDYTIVNTPKVVGGFTPDCVERARLLYGDVCQRVVPVSTLEAAEMTKLLENVFRSVNIALVNELSLLCDRMGIDVWEVTEAASTKPYGFMRFQPGPGMGGHCLPVDPFYLSWRAREFDVQAEFIELAGEVNQSMPYFCVERIARALNDQMKPVRGSTILIVGASYKPGVGDLRESPAIKIMRLLSDRGAQLCYHDDFVSELSEFGLRSEPLGQAASRADCVAIVTAHPEVDFERLAAEASLVVDFRGATRRAAARAPASLQLSS
jgi:UDP-N-acetyl-D-glucosamine dehydrogenase